MHPKLYPELELLFAGAAPPGLDSSKAAWQPQAEIATPPSGLPAIRHYTIAKKKDTATGSWVAASSSPSEMNPGIMNPGFLDLPGRQLIIAQPLQEALGRFIRTGYAKYIRGSNASANDDISVALVDLSGNRLATPQFAGWGSTVPRYAASTAKIAALYGIYQLKADLQQLLTTSPAANLNEARNIIGQYQRHNRLDAARLQWSRIFDFNFSGSKVAVSIGADLAKTIHDCFALNNNRAAGQLIQHLSYPYLGSVLWQSGLRHPTLGGLWQVGNYANRPWYGAPSIGLQYGSHTITALSAVTYFTLMAQGRLVSDEASQKITEVLRLACSYFWSGNMRARTGIIQNPPTKCGIWSKHKNDVILVAYHSGKYRYAACVLSHLAADPGFMFDDFLAGLDELVRNNNP